MPNVSVKVEGLAELSNIPGWLDTGQRVFLERGCKKIAEAIGEAAPRKSGRLAGSWKGRTISSTKGVVSSDLEYAKSIARGAYIAPKGQALRFHDGGFSRVPIRLKATNYDKKGLRKRNKIMAETFEQAFDDLRGN